MVHSLRGRRLIHVCLAFSFAALIAGGCREMKSPAVHVEPDSAVILLPGYYGTRLADVASGRIVWISIWESLFGRRSLALPLQTLGIHDAIAVKPDGILEDIPIIPFLYSLHGYGALIKKLEEDLGPRTRIVPLAYDWRLDLLDTVAELHRTVERLHAEGIARIALVAHSMGGLIAVYYLRYGTQPLDEAVEDWSGASHVDAVVLAGVPYRGSMTTFRNMQYGRLIGLNRRILSSTAVASFPASYYVLPAPGSDTLLSATMEKLEGLLYQSENWKRYGWGLMRDDAGMPEPIAAHRMAYTEQWLTRATRFFDLIDRPGKSGAQRRIPLLDVAGLGYETLASGFWLGPGARVSTNLLFDQAHVDEFAPGLDHSLLLSDGDGTVTLASASLPHAYGPAFSVRPRLTRLPHGSLVIDSELLDEMSAFLSSALIGP
jgi:pimeloyl-ACP methyl ester carboxylesterase